MSFTTRSFPQQALVLSAVLAIFPVTTSLGASPKNNNKNQAIIKKGNASELPVVKSVSKSGLTVGDKYYEVNDLTDITVNGEKATLSDIAVGMQASVAGGVKDFGANRDETIYKATRIIAIKDNELSKKANEFNKNAAKIANQNKNKNKNTRHK